MKTTLPIFRSSLLLFSLATFGLLSAPLLMAQRAVLYNLLVIGEAARSLAPDTRDRLPDVPWARVIGLRNILTHEYFKVDIGVVWGVVARHLPHLKTQIDALLAHD